MAPSNLCPCCNSKSVKKRFIARNNLYANTPNYEGSYAVCGGCGSFYIENFLPENKISQFYPKNYYTRKFSLETSLWFKWGLSAAKKECVKPFFRSFSKSTAEDFGHLIYRFFYWKRFNRLPLKNSSNNQMLEIGFGSGAYLFFLRKLGWICYGVDPDLHNKSKLEREGIRVEAEIDTLNLDPNSISFCYSYHAFEHIYEIDRYFEKIERILTQDGKFLLCVPFSEGLLPKLFKSNWFDLGFPIHKQIYSEKGIHSLCDRHGLKVKSLKTVSYADSLVGTIFISIHRIIFGSKSARYASILERSRLFRILVLMTSPLVFFLDKLKYGDRVEVWIMKDDKYVGL